MYIAKLAVLMSVPNIFTTHWLSARCARFAGESRGKTEMAEGVGLRGVDLVWVLQRVVLSDSSTPRSRASCSKVIGIKEP